MFAVAAFVCAFLCASPGVADPVTISHNGVHLPIPEYNELETVLPGEQGLSLAEVFPPQIEAWRLEADATILEQDDLGERLHDIFLLRTPAGWDLLLDRDGSGARHRIRNIGRLSLHGTSSTEKALEVWISWEGVPQLKTALAAWAAKAGIAIKVVDVPSIKSKLITILRGGGRVPDVVMVQSDYLPDLVAAGALQELDSLVLAADGAKARQAFTLQRRLLAAPFYCDTQLVFYSTRLVGTAPAAGWTLADMEALGKASGAKVPAAWNAYSSYWLLPFVSGFGRNPVIGADGRMNLADPAYAKALGYLEEAIDRGFLTPMEREAMMAYFSSGRAAFILSGSYSLPEFRRLELPFGIAPFPLTEKGGRPVAPLLDYKGFAVTRGTRNPVLARRLVQYLSIPYVQAGFCATQGKLPADHAAWELMPPDPYRPVLEASYKAGMVVPPEPAYGDFKNAMWKLIRLYFNGSISLEETIDSGRTILGEN
ncbi:MAG: extracellular solute-binding protein [Clostridia bacterium]|jgi:ABC-type glycerol-3-phosphate transport system substrate-binding protein